MSKTLLEAFIKRFPDEILSTHDHRGDETAVVKRDRIVEMMTWLRDSTDTELNMLVDVTAVDNLGLQTPRFEVVYHLLSLARGWRLRIKVPLDEKDLTVDSVCRVYESADWPEREVWDMYGIRFEGHPNLKRLLMYEEFEGHPLRKDYPIRKRQPLMPMKNPDA
ncbi:MAG: NADH-quinone oxidoreductase subunit C [Pseudomonadota bacterium]